jgi:hypothetical protein
MEVLFKKVLEVSNISLYQDHNEIEQKEVLFGVDITNHVEHQPKKGKFTFLKNISFADDESVKKHYGNPLASISIDRVTLVVERDETKVSLKFFFLHKHRKVGKPYFTKATSMSFITYKFETNDLFTGRIVNSFKKRKNVKSVKRNYFGENPISKIQINFKNFFNHYKKYSNSTSDGFDVVNFAINTFMSQIPNLERPGHISFDQELFRHYLTVRNIKYPDNYDVFMYMTPIPDKRTLKKCDNKFIDAFMLKRSLKGDKIRKVLHAIKERPNIEFYFEIEKFFGEKYLKNQNYDIIKDIFTHKGHFVFPSNEQFTETEIKNIFLVFSYFLKNETNFWSFTDHLRFYARIKAFEDIKWKSRDEKSFIREHSEWSEKFYQYLNGKYTRTYSQKFVDVINSEIIGDEFSPYYPVVLTENNQYFEESSVQSNCVKSYVNKPSSLIVSLRKQEQDSNVRATIEYIIFKEGDKIKLKRYQTLGRFNKTLDPSWSTVIDELDKRINYCAENKIFTTPKISVEIAGKIINSETKFNNNGTLVWENEIITGVNAQQVNHYELNF